MRSSIFFFLISCLLPFTVHGQEARINDPGFTRCSNTFEWHENKLATDPEYRQQHEDFQKYLSSIPFKSLQCDSIIKVPVAVHFDPGIVTPGSESCAIDLVVDQINALNLEIRGMDPQNSAFSGLESCFGPNPVNIGDACIELCLATTNHPPGSGVSEGEYAVTFGTSSGYPMDATWSGYLNIWIEDTGGGLLGQSTHIGGPFNGSGVRVNACNFGTGDVNCPGWNNTSWCGGGTFNEGNTVIHEVGHYIDLLHNFNGGCGAQNDGISDTPAMSDTHGGFTGCISHNDCNDLSGLDSCPGSPGSDMYMNYMSYAGDRCMYMFTAEQATVMHAWVKFQNFTSTNNKCLPPAAPVAAMLIPDGNVCEGVCLNFEDQSTNIPNSWNWTFTVISGDINIDITNSTVKNPSVCITSGTFGNIQVELTVSNEIGMDTAPAQNLVVNILPDSTLECACISVANTGVGTLAIFGNILQANMCILGCPTISPTAEVGANEGFIMSSLQAGVNYTFEFCTNYNAATWQANIGVAHFDIPDGIIGDAVAWQKNTCTLDFSVPSDGDYIVIVSEEGNCGETYNPTGNGQITFTCLNSSCPNTCSTNFYDRRGPHLDYSSDNAMNMTLGDEMYILCPDIPGQNIELTFTAFEIEPNGANNCWDYMEIFDGKDMTDPQIGGQYCGFTVADAPGAGAAVVSTHPSGCLTVFFNPDGSVSYDGWEATLSCAGVVPIELISFNAKAQNRAIYLDWGTATEINNKGFDIQRSTNPVKGFESIGWANAKIGSNNEYQFIDYSARPNTLYYYQLLQHDLDGTTTRSQIVSAKWNTQDFYLSVYPNPTSHQVTIDYADLESDNRRVIVFDLLGKEVFQQALANESRLTTLDLSQLGSGMYIISIVNSNNEIIGIQRIVKRN